MVSHLYQGALSSCATLTKSIVIGTVSYISSASHVLLGAPHLLSTLAMFLGFASPQWVSIEGGLELVPQATQGISILHT